MVGEQVVGDVEGVSEAHLVKGVGVDSPRLVAAEVEGDVVAPDEDAGR